MSAIPTNPTTVRSVCRGCGHEGEIAVSPPSPGKRLTSIKPAWCTCTGKHFGPYEAPKGYVAKFTFGPRKLSDLKPGDLL
jgi:hypothetical protein